MTSPADTAQGRNKMTGLMAKQKAVKDAPNRLMRIATRSAAISLLAIGGSFAWLIFSTLPQHNERQSQRASHELAAGQAQLLNDWVQQLQARLAAAASDPALASGLAASGADLSALQASLQKAFPEAQTLRLIALGPLGIANLNDGAAGLRNNIEADMLRRVSDGSQSGPEAYRLDKTWHVSFVQPIVASGNNYASGALLLTLPATRVEQLLNSHLAGRGSSALLQQFGNQAKTVAAAGTGDVEALRELQPLSVAQWRLQFTPAASWLKSWSLPPLPLWLAFAFSALATLAGALLGASDIRRALARNSTSLPDAGSQSVAGAASPRAQQQSGVEPAAALASPAQEKPAQPAQQRVEEIEHPSAAIPDTIFRAYDIRGIARHQLTDDIVYQIGLAIGSEAVDRGQQEVIVARDGRASSPAIANALIRGLRDSGRDVVDIGMMPTPLLYFATHKLGSSSGVVVTGSHNPPEYNGLKIVLGGRALAGAAIQTLKERIAQRHFSSGTGDYREARIEDQYIDYIVNDVAIAQPLKIVIDAGNGVTGVVAPRLFQELGCDVIPLYCDIDPDFPHHHPDPTVADNLRDLVQLVRENGADLGIAFDGDGDRVGVVSASGAIVPADRLLMLLAQDVVSRNPGADVLFDVKCSRNLNSVISSYGGRPIMWKSGHSFMKEKMAETGALLGGEFSGHIFFNERWFGFDDGMYAAARLIEVLSTTDPNLDNHLASLPSAISTPELKLDTSEQAKFDIIGKLVNNGEFGDGKITTLDGLRVDFPDGWGLVRASNTTPSLTLRFEAADEGALARIQSIFKDQLAAIDPQLHFGF